MRLKITSIVLCAAMLLSLTACFGDKDTTQETVGLEKKNAPITNGHQIETLTLEEAQKKVPYKILVPTYLPEKLAFDHAYVSDGTAYVSEPTGGAVVLGFTNGNSGFIVVEQQGKMEQLQGSIEKQVTNTMLGQYYNNEQQFEPTLLWHNGNIVCRIYTNERSSFSNEQSFVQIASSFK
jgi:hypothetical protein